VGPIPAAQASIKLPSEPGLVDVLAIAAVPLLVSRRASLAGWVESAPFRTTRTVRGDRVALLLNGRLSGKGSDGWPPWQERGSPPAW
jgi:hypothetical protein